MYMCSITDLTERYLRLHGEDDSEYTAQYELVWKNESTGDEAVVTFR